MEQISVLYKKFKEGDRTARNELVLHYHEKVKKYVKKVERLSDEEKDSRSFECLKVIIELIDNVETTSWHELDKSINDSCYEILNASKIIKNVELPVVHPVDTEMEERITSKLYFLYVLSNPMITEEERSVIFLKYYNKMSGTEIALEMGKDTDTISILLASALEKIRNITYPDLEMERPTKVYTKKK